MTRAVITYAAGAHEELLDVALPGYKAFALRHGYDMLVGGKMCDLPPAWNKVPLLIEALALYDEVVWFDCDLVVVDPREDFPLMASDPARGEFTTEPAVHALVRHFEDDSEVPNSGVWRLRRCDAAVTLLHKILELEVFRDHGWWEQAALMTLMGYTVPPEGSDFPRTKCRRVQETQWSRGCRFMRLAWNSHPNYRADPARIVHCSYPNMPQRIEVMRALVRDPRFDYPRYDRVAEPEEHGEDQA